MLYPRSAATAALGSASIADCNLRPYSACASLGCIMMAMGLPVSSSQTRMQSLFNDLWTLQTLFFDGSGVRDGKEVCRK